MSEEPQTPVRMSEVQQTAVRELLRIAPVVDELGARFAEAGEQIALVGGPVRDAMLGRLHNDLDFTTSARPEVTERLLKGWAEAIWDMGRDFGTIGCRFGPWQIEITTYRSEEYDAVLRTWLVRYAFESVHIRHIAWHSLGLVDEARRLGLPVIFSFHDFYTVCPTVKLLDVLSDGSKVANQVQPFIQEARSPRRRRSCDPRRKPTMIKLCKTVAWSACSTLCQAKTASLSNPTRAKTRSNTLTGGSKSCRVWKKSLPA